MKDSIRTKYLHMYSLSKDYILTLFIEVNSGERTIGTIYKAPSLSKDYILTLFIEVNSGERTIGTIYKAPTIHIDRNVFIDNIQNILSTINQSKIHDLMLCCDFNTDILHKDCNNSTLFLNTICIHCHFWQSAVNQL